jgi:hypothetical protein
VTSYTICEGQTLPKLDRLGEVAQPPRPCRNKVYDPRYTYCIAHEPEPEVLAARKAENAARKADEDKRERNRSRRERNERADYVNWAKEKADVLLRKVRLISDSPHRCRAVAVYDDNALWDGGEPIQPRDWDTPGLGTPHPVLIQCAGYLGHDKFGTFDAHGGHLFAVPSPMGLFGYGDILGSIENGATPQ